MRYVHRWLLGTMVALVGAGCTPQAARAPSPPAAQGEPSLRAIQGAQPPLVTWDPTPPSPGAAVAFPYATVGQGTLDISTECVVLLFETGYRVLLVWPEPTAWNAASQTIEFVSPRHGHARVAVRDGDQIIPGGVGTAGIPSWVATRAPACQADETFLVNQVEVVAAE